MSDEYTTLQIGSATIIQLDRPAPLAQVATVSMYQARVALQQAGLLDQVDGAIAALDEPSKTQAQIAWEFKTTVSRDGPLLVLIAAQLDLSESQLNELFAAAAAVT